MATRKKTVVTDIDGTAFDADKHRVDEDGKPILTPRGQFISKRGRKSYNVDRNLTRGTSKILTVPEFYKGFLAVLKEHPTDDALQLEEAKNLFLTWGPKVGLADSRGSANQAYCLNEAEKKGSEVERIAGRLTRQNLVKWYERICVAQAPAIAKNSKIECPEEKAEKIELAETFLTEKGIARPAGSSRTYGAKGPRNMAEVDILDLFEDEPKPSPKKSTRRKRTTK